MNLGTKATSPTRLALCKRCGRRAFAWHRSPATNQRWRLYEPSPVQPDGQVYADTDRPHVCTAPEPVPSPSAAVPGAFVDDEPEPEPARMHTPNGGDLAATIAAAVAPFVRGAVDADTVRAIVREELANAAPTTIERTINVTVARQDGSTAALGLAHQQLEELLYLTKIAPATLKWPLMYGAPGGGKSHAAHQVADALGLPFYYVALTPGLPDSRLFGYLDANRLYARTVLREAYENGGVCCLDELDNASDTTVTGLNALLANGTGSFPDGIVPRHADFRLIATANTPLRGGSRNHAGRRALDGATLDRFAFLEWHYDEALESARVAAILPGSSGRAWLDWLRAVRAYATAHVPQLVVSQRAAVAGAVALAEGLPSGKGLDWLARVIVFAGLEPATIESIVNACPLPSAGKVAA